MSKIKIKLLDENCKPTKKHRWDAGWDLKAAETTVIKPSETVKVHTGVITEIPARFFGMVVPRSGLGTKHHITLANDVGIIDSEYRGEIMVFLTNNGSCSYTIEQYDRFAQLIIVPVNTSELWIVENLSVTGRGDGGFGSTGIKHEDTPNITDVPKNIPKVESKTITEKEPTINVEEERQKKLEELRKLKPGQYMKLKNSGKLFDEYPIATGDMNEDLGL